MDELVKLAYSMRKKSYNKGSLILKQGDRVDSVAILKKGSVKIVHKMNKQRANKSLPYNGRKESIISNSSKAAVETVEVSVDIAEVGPSDLLAVVEAMINSKKMRNNVFAQNPTEAFFVQTNMFISFLKHEKKTLAYLEKLGKETSFSFFLHFCGCLHGIILLSGETAQMGSTEKRLCIKVCIHYAIISTKESRKDVQLCIVTRFYTVRKRIIITKY